MSKHSFFLPTFDIESIVLDNLDPARSGAKETCDRDSILQPHNPILGSRLAREPGAGCTERQRLIGGPELDDWRGLRAGGVLRGLGGEDAQLGAGEGGARGGNGGAGVEAGVNGFSVG